jgi:uncharacterized protein YdhG (YjbR/CyaY superfamily)
MLYITMVPWAVHGTTIGRHAMRTSKNVRVDEYIAKAPKPAQQMMKQIRTAIRATVPEAEEKMSYGIPFYEYRFPGYKGRLAYFGAYKKHISFYAVPHNIPVALDKKLERYKAARATLQFRLGTKIPVGLLKRLVKLRKDEIDGRKS